MKVNSKDVIVSRGAGNKEVCKDWKEGVEGIEG
jgi:hypothetical protein